MLIIDVLRFYRGIFGVIVFFGGGLCYVFDFLVSFKGGLFWGYFCDVLVDRDDYGGDVRCGWYLNVDSVLGIVLIVFFVWFYFILRLFYEGSFVFVIVG